MTNFYRAVKALEEADEFHGAMVDNEAYVRALQADDLLVPEVQIIRTPDQLQALAQEDPNAVVLAGYVGVPRPAHTLYEMDKYGHKWILPAAVIASGAQVRAAREAMETSNE